MKTKHAVVTGAIAALIVVDLIKACKWFECMPLPGDAVEITAKNEPRLSDWFK